MIKDERLEQILEHVTRQRSVSLTELSTALNVSEDTIRRDIKILADKGQLKAVRGGAVAHSPIPHHYRAREKHDMAQKRIVAAKALQFIQDGQVIFLDGGTSIQALAEIIPPEMKITVVTHSFPVVSVLEDHPNAEVIFAGGRLSKLAFTTTGYETIQTFKNFRADLCLFSVCSIHPTMGLTTVEHEEAQVKRTMMEMAGQNIALSTIDKLNTAESYYISPMTDIDVIVTDVEPVDERLVAYRKLGIAVV
ncbi:DeoR/GlpR family DNA-binding transcription regulator [Mucilaginibacter pedocola]|uniref:DeoR family transcriptional regulator n=1 Tax=Mucilaginibacter pedocola TaxID=1792845 RepID=A0A1S9PLC8_9SPHI|nr:DeoR/GlpR family DNA-binding transcription regulator [Mucilaginibacter pedocola]OOQ61745.1 DeoR family transcriptional regulator [Mucilaginibacter pedocola]